MATINCDGCGTVLKELTPEEEDDVASSEMQYMNFCRSCTNDVGGLTF